MSTIQWFPGHMAKARKEVIEKLPLVDIVIELVDARLPLSSRNPMLDKLIQNKPHLILLNKKDLADPNQTQKWIHYFEEQQMAALAINAKKNQQEKIIIKKCQEILADKIARREAKGLKPKAIRAMIIGIPNVGKSTLLNRMLNKKIAKTGNKPGVTKAQQWLKVAGALELLDTPGILWPKFEDQTIGLKLALTGAIKDDLYHVDDVALYGLEFFKKTYPERLKEDYKLSEIDLDQPMAELLLLLTQKRGYRDDYERMSVQIIQDIRQGKLGAYTLDMVEEDVIKSGND